MGGGVLEFLRPGEAPLEWLLVSSEGVPAEWAERIVLV